MTRWRMSGTPPLPKTEVELLREKNRALAAALSSLINECRKWRDLGMPLSDGIERAIQRAETP